jgi:alkylation response protein AidB-like acyl-CoA dehydrogenase
MDFRFAPEDDAFRAELRAFLEQHWPAEYRGGNEYGPGYSSDVPAREAEFRRKLGERGWIAINLPKEYGGGGATILQRLIFADEMSYYGAPYSNTATGYVAPTLIKHGSDEQKQTFLPAITQGAIDFALGYTEPNAGSDLAGVSTRAVEDGEGFLLSGQKVYTTMAHKAQYLWCIARTDPKAARHKGLTIFIVDLKAPGVDVRPLWTIDDGRTNEVFLDEVRVPRSRVVGEVNRGWYVVSVALDHERFNGFPLGNQRFILDQLVSLVKTESWGGRPLREIPWVRAGIGEASARLQAAQAIQYRCAWISLKGGVPNTKAAMMKILASELKQFTSHFASRVAGLYGTLAPGSPWAPLGGRLVRSVRGSMLSRFAGGSNEIQRNIIAGRGLGLPRDGLG